jgi:hypothetical protein
MKLVNLVQLNPDIAPPHLAPIQVSEQKFHLTQYIDSPPEVSMNKEWKFVSAPLIVCEGIHYAPVSNRICVCSCNTVEIVVESIGAEDTPVPRTCTCEL